MSLKSLLLLPYDTPPRARPGQYMPEAPAHGQPATPNGFGFNYVCVQKKGGGYEWVREHKYWEMRDYEQMVRNAAYLFGPQRQEEEDDDYHPDEDDDADSDY